MNMRKSYEMLNNVLVYIPSYNAAKTLPKVFSRIPEDVRRNVGEILVVDNASQDGTSEVALDWKQRPGFEKIQVIRNSKNLGYGGSQKLAYRYSIDKGYQVVAMLHGDAQYAPELVQNLIQPILKNKADMIFGSRMAGHPLKGGMPLVRFLGNRFLTSMQNLFLGAKLTEYHSGYRVFSVSALARLDFNRLSSDYHFDTEIIILLLNKGLRISEVPIPTHYGDEKNYVNIWKYGIDVMVTTLTYFFHKYGLRKSRRWSYILDGIESKNPDHGNNQRESLTKIDRIPPKSDTELQPDGFIEKQREWRDNKDCQA